MSVVVLHHKISLFIVRQHKVIPKPMQASISLHHKLKQTCEKRCFPSFKMALMDKPLQDLLSSILLSSFQGWFCQCWFWHNTEKQCLYWLLFHALYACASFSVYSCTSFLLQPKESSLRSSVLSKLSVTLFPAFSCNYFSFQLLIFFLHNLFKAAQVKS